MLRVTDGAAIAARDEIVTQACIVGSGAGGAVVACRLAESGIAVTVLEEGRLWQAPDYPNDPLEFTAKLYRGGGAIGSLGTPTIPIAMGRTVGGTTTLNAGTCLRPSAFVLERWAREHGIAWAPALGPHFDRVERSLGVAPVPEELLGPTGEVARRGAAKLGYRAFPTPRNALGCRGEGRCSFGCPHEAKRGMAQTFLPRAVAAGATIIARCRAERILTRGGRARVIEASVPAPESGRRRLRVRAEAIVVAGGAVPTPLLLLASGIRAGGRVGARLHLHPASRAIGFFDEPIQGRPGVFQSYIIDQHAHEGILIETVRPPPALVAPTLPDLGAANAAWMRRFAHAAVLGVMVSDASQGRVRRGAFGAPFVTYQLGRSDTARLRRGIAEAARILIAAGAREVLAGVHGATPLRSMADIDDLLACEVCAADLEIVSLHPHGTCGMGANQRSSVVGLDFEVHGVPGLFVCDASVVPEALGVNPQLTIMALADRCAEELGERLRARRAAAP